MNNEKKIAMTINSIITWIIVVDASLLIFPFEYISESFAKFITDNKNIELIVFILALSNYISQFILFVFNKTVAKVNEKSKIEQINKAITCLDFSERALLREFILQRKSVINLPINEPSVRNLLNNRILSITDEIIDNKGRSPMMINTDARPYITYRAVGLSKGKMSEEQIEQIIKARPQYAKSIV